MRVAIELTALELDAGGTGRAIECLLPELERQPGVELVRLRHPGAPRPGEAGRVLRGLARELRYLPHELPRAARRAGAELLHCPAPLAPPRSPVPMVITIHDVIAFEHPEWLGRANAWRSKLLLPRSLRGAARVIVSSEYSRGRLTAVLGLPPERTVVVPLGVDARFTPGAAATPIREQTTGGAPYVFTAGTLQPRKNLAAALTAFERAAAAGAAHHLVIAGARGWRDEEILRRVAESPVAPRVHLAGRVSDAELVDLYRGADVFVFPSLYEGFGLPVLEAMACGTPVICSDRTSLPEIAGDAAKTFDPADGSALAEALAELLAAPELRASLAARGITHAAEFTWGRTARLTARVYADALNQP